MDRSWYDNPYYMANEVTSSSNYDVINAFLNASYQITPWLKLALRSGADVYTQKNEWKTPVGSVSGWGKRKDIINSNGAVVSVSIMMPC